MTVDFWANTLAALGVREEEHVAIVTAARDASSMKGNPVGLPQEARLDILRQA